MRRILYVRLAHFHTAVQALLEPRWRGRCLLVARGNYEQGQVIGLSPESLAAGVEVGMSWRRARRRCPDAVILPYERAHYASILDQLGNLMTRFTPWVETLPGVEGEFFANLGEGALEEGCGLANQIRAQIAGEISLEARLGLATGKIVAHTLVDHSPSELGITREALRALVEGRERRYLAPLPVECLWELAPEALRRLRLLGLRTLGQVTQLPARVLTQPLGPAARWYRALARGEDRRRVAVWQPAPVETAACFVEDGEPVLAILERSLERLSQRVAGALLRDSLYGRSVSVAVHMAGGARRFSTRHLKEPTHLWRTIFRTARALLAALLPDIAVSIEVLELRIGGLETQGAIQLSIFGDEDRGPVLRSTIARLQDRFGERAIGQLSH